VFFSEYKLAALDECQVDFTALEEDALGFKGESFFFETEARQIFRFLRDFSIVIKEEAHTRSGQRSGLMPYLSSRA